MIQNDFKKFLICLDVLFCYLQCKIRLKNVKKNTSKIIFTKDNHEGHLHGKLPTFRLTLRIINYEVKAFFVKYNSEELLMMSIKEVNGSLKYNPLIFVLSFQQKVHQNHRSLC